MGGRKVTSRGLRGQTPPAFALFLQSHLQPSPRANLHSLSSIQIFLFACPLARNGFHDQNNEGKERRRRVGRFAIRPVNSSLSRSFLAFSSLWMGSCVRMGIRTSLDKGNQEGGEGRGDRLCPPSLSPSSLPPFIWRRREEEEVEVLRPCIDVASCSRFCCTLLTFRCISFVRWVCSPFVRPVAVSRLSLSLVVSPIPSSFLDTLPLLHLLLTLLPYHFPMFFPSLLALHSPGNRLQRFSLTPSHLHVPSLARFVSIQVFLLYSIDHSAIHRYLLSQFIRVAEKIVGLRRRLCDVSESPPLPSWSRLALNDQHPSLSQPQLFSSLARASSLEPAPLSHPQQHPLNSP